MTEEQLSFVTEKPLKLIIRYSFPAVVALIINGLQGMIDGIFVGTFINSSALASVNIASPYIQIVIGISMIASIGTQSQVGIYFGSGENKLGKDTFQTILRTISVLAIIMTIIAFGYNHKIASVLGADSTLLEGTAIYIKTLSVFALPMCLMFYFGFLNRIVGKPQLYFYGSIISIVTNVSLNYIFLTKLNLGVRGAALATGIAYTSAFFIVAVPFFCKSSVLNINTGDFNKKTILPVLYNGASEGVNSLSAAITMFIFNKILMEVAGADGVAAFTAVNYIGAFGILLLFGISDGIGPIVSYNYGAKKTNRVKRVMEIAFIGNFVFGVMLFLILMFCGNSLVGLFIRDNADLVLFAANGSKIYAFAFLFSGFNILVSGYFTFIGKGMESALVAGSRGLIFIIVGIICLPRIFEIDGVWMSIPFAELTTALIAIILLRRNRKIG